MLLTLDDFLKNRSLQLIEHISKGFSSDVFLAKNQNGKRFALKVEREKSRRVHMALKEKLFLEKANSVGVGPKLIDSNTENGIILMEFVDGEPFGKWVLEKGLARAQLKKTINSLFVQAKKLDELGLDHGQLAGKGANILVKKNGVPVIVDFEKASLSRRAHNVSQLESFLFKNPHGAVAKRVRDCLEL